MSFIDFFVPQTHVELLCLTSGNFREDPAGWKCDGGRADVEV